MLQITPQNAGNGISETLNFKIFQMAMSPGYLNILKMLHSNIVVNLPLTNVPKLSLDYYFLVTGDPLFFQEYFSLSVNNQYSAIKVVLCLDNVEIQIEI